MLFPCCVLTVRQTGHVDDLKGELAREIATMTKRVAYLQRTSHEWEARIADLLTFYKKQGGHDSHLPQASGGMTAS